MVLGVYEHFLQVFVEFIFIPRKLHIHNWKKYFTFGCPPKTADLLVSDRAKILVTGHFGNWEMAGYYLAMVGLKPTSIARDLDNPFLHDFVLRLRRWSGQKIVSKKGDFDQIVQTLVDRQALVSVADQSAGPRGLFVDFFGRPASTHKAIALLAIEHDAPVIVGYAYRDRLASITRWSPVIFSIPATTRSGRMRSPPSRRTTPSSWKRQYAGLPVNTFGCTTAGSISPRRKR